MQSGKHSTVGVDEGTFSASVTFRAKRCRCVHGSLGNGNSGAPPHRTMTHTLGILGGTFDPIHYGHLRFAAEVRAMLGLAQIHLVPSGVPPHRAAPFASSEDRLAMTTLGCAEFPGLVADGRRVVCLGGDHTIALPLLRAVAAEYGPIALVHFDAHLDTWDTYFGAPYTHGTPFRRAVEEGLLDLDVSAHVGIRGPLYSAQDLIDDQKLGFAIVSTDDVARRGVDEALDRVRARVGDRPVYVSIDIDVLDPAHAPGTGTPEPGGLTMRELQMILRGFTDLNLVGGDVVEVAPAYDHAELTTIAAANVVYELLGLMALDRPGAQQRGGQTTHDDGSTT